MSFSKPEFQGAPQMAGDGVYLYVEIASEEQHRNLELNEAHLW